MQAPATFRKKLRAEMKKRGISQRAIAETAGTGYPNVNRVLCGKQTPTLDLADRLADAVGKTLAELLRN